MNILCLDQFPQLGGAQRCFVDLATRFCQRGWRVRAAVPGEGPFTDKLRESGCSIEVLPSCSLSSSRKSISDGFRYARWCSEIARAIHHAGAAFNPDLLYVNGPRLLPTAACIARRNGIPLLFHAHNRLVQKAALVLTGACLKYSRAQVIACCQYVGDSLRPYVSRERLAVVYNGVSDLRGPSRSDSKGIQVIGVVGRIEPEKGQLDFIRAARIVHRECPNCRFLVIGTPLLSNSETYHQQVVEESLDLPVVFTGWQENISSVLSNLDCLVVPSRSLDATPRVVLEAFSAGVPVISFAVGGIPEIIEDGRTGFLVEIRSPEALALGILNFLQQDREKVARVIANARSAWREKFSLDRYQELISERIEQIVPQA